MSISPARAATLRSLTLLSGRCVIGPAVLALCSLTGCEVPELPETASATTASENTPGEATASAPESERSREAPTAAPELPPEPPAAAPEATPASEGAAAPVDERGAGEVPPPTTTPAESAPAPSELTDAAAAADQFAAARASFSNSCQRCHSIADGEGAGGTAGGPGRMRGPSLAHVGADPGHDATWIAAHIRDPKSHNPRSRMPAFASRLGEAEIQQLAEFLATLK
jgi:mono/diheme cytochrome c family protein